MANSAPPSVPNVLRSSLPWLVAIGIGISAHAWFEWTRPERTVQVVSLPAPPTVVTVQQPTDPPDCRRDSVSNERRQRRRARKRSRPGPETTSDFVSCSLGDQWVCTVARSVLTGVLEGDSGGLHRQARLIPAKEDGKIVGLKLFALKKGSILHGLQFRNGDLLTSIDGEAIDDIDVALRHASDVRERLETDEEPVELRVGVRRRGAVLEQLLIIE